jgi:hypothetical protein
MTRTIARIALLAGLIALAGCEHKETGRRNRIRAPPRRLLPPPRR